MTDPKDPNRREFLRAALIAAVAPSLVLGCDDDTASATPDALEDTRGADTASDVMPDSISPQDTALAEVDAAPPDTTPPPQPFDPSPYTEDAARFPYGVQSGAMRSTSVIVWTLQAAPEPLTLRLWREDDQLIGYEGAVSADDAGYAKIGVEGLEPGVWYRYAFFTADDRRSLIGRVRTALPEGALEPLTLAGCTCTNIRNSPFDALSMMAAEPIDMICHLGDMSYNDSASTLDAYRALWRETLDTPGYRTLLPQAGMYITWDDHEVDNNWDPESIDATRLTAAKQAYFETLANERGPNDRLWNSYRWGNTAEVFILDARSERLPSTRRSDTAVYLGAEQMSWLKEGLQSSPCHFKIVLNSVPITNMPLLWDAAPADRWEGYRAQRDELLDFIEAQSVEHVVFLSGDFHVGFVARVERSGAGSTAYEIAVGPTGNGPNPLGLGGFPDEQFLFHHAYLEATTVLVFDPVASTLHVRFVDARDNVVLFDQVLAF